MSSTYGFRVLEMEIRKLKRALWLARAKEASRMKQEYKVMCDFGLWKKWDCVECKCRLKAEEYLG